MQDTQAYHNRKALYTAEIAPQIKAPETANTPTPLTVLSHSADT